MLANLICGGNRRGRAVSHIRNIRKCTCGVYVRWDLLGYSYSYFLCVVSMLRIEKCLVPSSGKMVLLDKLLPKLRAEKHKVQKYSNVQNHLSSSRAIA